MNIDLSGRHALVTGASQGLGAASAIALAASGARVTLTARSAENLQQVLASLPGPGHDAVASDLMAATSPKAVADFALERGPVDIVLHAAGGNLGYRDQLGPSEEWAAVWRLNVGCLIDLNNALIPSMQARKWGRIIHFSSRSTVTFGGAPAYAAAKTHLNAYNAILARTLAPDGIVVSALAPGAVSAPGNNWELARRKWPENVAKYVAEHQSIGRLGEPDDITPFVVFMASEYARFAGGAIVPIDGASK